MLALIGASERITVHPNDIYFVCSTSYEELGAEIVTRTHHLIQTVLMIATIVVCIQ